VKARELRPGMILRLSGGLKAGLIVHPGTVAGRTGNVTVMAPLFELDPEREVSVVLEGEDVPETMPVQIKLVER